MAVNQTLAARRPNTQTGALELVLQARAQAGDFTLDLDLRVARGPVALIGANGAGKTSALRLLAGGLTPSAGRAQLGGRTLFDVSRGVSLPPEARRLGYLPQDGALFPHLSVEDNVAFGARAPDRRAQARALLRRFGVEALASRRPRGLSGGERQRVALARALAAEPELLLLDEPTAWLDVGARKQARELLGQVFRDLDGCAVIVTHDLRDLIAWRPTLVLLEAGRVQAVGSLEALAEVEHPFLEELLGPWREASAPGVHSSGSM